MEMYRFMGNVKVRRVEGSSRYREEAIDAARIVFESNHLVESLEVPVRVNFYQEVVSKNPGFDVFGATYVGELGTLAVRHCREWFRNDQQYRSKLEFHLFTRDSKTGDHIRKGILRSVRRVGK